MVNEYDHHIGRKLRTFTQLKRNKRFDNFIMLVWVQGSPFHIAAGSHPVQEAWGSQDSFYRGQIQKILQCCREPYHQIPLVITIQKKYTLTYLITKRYVATYRFVIIEGKVKGQIFDSTGVKQVKMIQFCWQWSQNVHLVNTMKNQNSFPNERCFVAMVTQQKRSANGHLHSDCITMLPKHATHSKLF